MVLPGHCDICGRKMFKFEVDGQKVYKCPSPQSLHERIIQNRNKGTGRSTRARSGKRAGRPKKKK